MINMELLKIIMLPFLGTALGAGCVLFMKGALNDMVRRILTGFAAGVMVAASIWSLIIPAMDQSEHMGKFAFMPAVIGVWLGILFLLLLDRVVPHIHLGTDETEGPDIKLKRTTKLLFAVTLHNIPEGMAVGAGLSGWLAGESSMTYAGALALTVGIAIQNFPEGAIISMPLNAEGVSKGRSFLYGALSGIAEPLAAAVTIMFAAVLIPTVPYLLCFAAGAMLYVVVEELIPEMAAGKHSNLGTLSFTLGFTLMMILDVALG